MWIRYIRIQIQILAAGKPPKGTIPLPPYTEFAKAYSSCPSFQTRSAQDPPPDSQGPMCWWLSSSINPTGGPEPSHHCYIVPLAWFHPAVCLFRHHPLAVELATSSRERSLAGKHLLPWPMTSPELFSGCFQVLHYFYSGAPECCR
jgi:hypothetical protein